MACGIGNSYSVAPPVYQARPYSAKAQEALDYSDKKLQKFFLSEAKEFKFLGNAIPQPINKKIGVLYALLDVYLENLRCEISYLHTDTWKDSDTLKTANKCMKIAFALSSYTIEDLPAYITDLESKGIKMTYAEALTNRKIYMNQSLYFLGTVYRIARSSMISMDGYICPQDKNPKDLPFKAFYEEGTMQHSWQNLHNEFYDRLHSYVNDEELEAADPYFNIWIEKDTKPEDFQHRPLEHHVN